MVCGLLRAIYIHNLENYKDSIQHRESIAQDAIFVTARSCLGLFKSCMLHALRLEACVWEQWCLEPGLAGLAGPDGDPPLSTRAQPRAKQTNGQG